MPRLMVSGSRHGHPEVERMLAGWVTRHGKPTAFLVGDEPCGVDRQAAEWAAVNLTPDKIMVFVADWKTLGAAAGPVRNGKMVAAEVAARQPQEPRDHLLAFPQPDSDGTIDCALQASMAGIYVFIHPPTMNLGDPRLKKRTFAHRGVRR